MRKLIEGAYFISKLHGLHMSCRQGTQKFWWWYKVNPKEELEILLNVSGLSHLFFKKFIDSHVTNSTLVCVTGQLNVQVKFFTTCLFYWKIRA